MANRTGETLQDSTAGIKSAAAVDVSSTDADLGRVTRGLYIGGAGDVAVQFAGDNSSVTLAGLAPGVWHPVQVMKVLKTGTTASGILAGY